MIGKALACVALFSLLVVTSASKESILSVTQPQKLIDLIEHYNRQNMKNFTEERKNVIECELSNFGEYQYGSKTLGQMRVSVPFDACNNTAIQNFSGDEFSQRIPFLLVERGGECGFVDKVYNAQEIGAQVVIIADNVKQRGSVIMVDNGHGRNVHIASVFISKEHGKVIKAFAEQHPESQIILSLELFQKKEQHSQARFWVDLASPLSINMVRSFIKIRKQIKDNNFNSEPIFAMQKLEKPELEEDCLKIGINYFCVPDPDLTTKSKNVATGRDVIFEILRHGCILNQGEDYWYQYFKKFGEECAHNPQYYQICGIQAFNNIQGLDLKALSSCLESETDKLRILNNQVEQNKLFNVFEWPALSVNDQVIRGSLTGHSIAQAICNSLEKIDDNCLLIIDPSAQIRTNTQEEIKQQIEEESSIFWTLFFIIVGFIGLFLIMAFGYKKIVKREISTDMNQSVNQMVSQYIAFYETRGKGNTEQSDL